jgi:hypothetical protein
VIDKVLQYSRKENDGDGDKDEHATDRYAKTGREAATELG